MNQLEYLKKWLYGELNTRRMSATYKPVFVLGIMRILANQKLQTIQPLKISLTSIADEMLRLYWVAHYKWMFRQNPAGQSQSEVAKFFCKLNLTPIQKLFSYGEIRKLLATNKSFRTRWEKARCQFIKVLATPTSKGKGRARQVWMAFNQSEQLYSKVTKTDPSENYLVFNAEQMKCLNPPIIRDIIVFFALSRWTQLVEKYNLYNYQVYSKLELAYTGKRPSRSDLKKERELLRDFSLNTEPDRVIHDFYSAAPLTAQTREIDHFIPWSYVYNNNPANLVWMEKKTNIQKSNYYWKDSFHSTCNVERLHQRNLELIAFLKNTLRETPTNNSWYNSTLEKVKDWENNFKMQLNHFILNFSSWSADFLVNQTLDKQV